MCYRILGWACTVPVPDTSCRAVLVCLSNYASQQGEAWPSFATLSRDTLLDRSTVIRKLATLQQLGLITRSKRSGHHGQTSNCYRFLGVAQCDPETVFGVAQDHHRGGTVRPEPTNEPIRPLPPGWGPSSDEVADMHSRYPELDIDASTNRFTSHFSRKTSEHRTDTGWLERWKAWISEDGSRPGRSKRTAARPTRVEQLGERNRRSVDEALALIAALPIDMADHAGPGSSEEAA